MLYFLFCIELDSKRGQKALSSVFQTSQVEALKGLQLKASLLALFCSVLLITKTVFRGQFCCVTTITLLEEKTFITKNSN